MGQQEARQFLEKERESHDNWFRIGEIRNALIHRGVSNGGIKGLASDLYKLATFNVIQVKGVGLWKHHKEFRAYKNDKRNN